MDQDYIYVISGESGVHSAYVRWLVSAHTSSSDAIEVVEGLNDDLSRLNIPNHVTEKYERYNGDQDCLSKLMYDKKAADVSPFEYGIEYGIDIIPVICIEPTT